MLKNILKSCITAAAVVAMAAPAMAADEGKLTLGADAVEYFGQYTTGEKNYGDHFMSIGEAHLKISGSHGKMSFYHEIETKLGPASSGAGIGKIEKADFKNTQTRLSYTSEFGLITIGNVVNIGTVPMSGSGFKTSNVPGSTSLALAVAGYSEYEGVQLHVPLGDLGFVQATIREGSFNYLVTGNATELAELSGGLTALGDDPSGSFATFAAASAITEGTMYNLGANLSFGMVGVRLGYMTSATDVPEDKNDDSMAGTGMLVAFNIALSEQMAITIDYASGTISHKASSDDLVSTVYNVGINAAAGPGKVTARYEMYTTGFSDTFLDITKIHLVYDIPVAKGAGIRLGYASNTKTYKDFEAKWNNVDLKYRNAETQSFIGAGFYAAF